MKLRAHIQTLEGEVYFLQEELKDKYFLLSSLITDKQDANIYWKLLTTFEKSTSLSKKQTLLSNRNIDFHVNNGLKNKHISEANKVKKVFFTTGNLCQQW